VVFHKSFLSIAPEPFEAVNVDSPFNEIFTMVQVKMSIATKHERVIDFEFIGIDNATSSYFFNGKAQYRLSLDVWDYLHIDFPLSFQDAEYRYLIGGSTATLAFVSAAEVGFIEFHFTSQQLLGILSMSDNSRPQGGNSFIGGVVGDTQLLGHLSCGYLQLKKFNHPQPLSTREMAMVDPPATEVMKSIFASAASTASIRQTIEFPTVTTRTNSLLVFPAKSQHIPTG